MDYVQKLKRVVPRGLHPHLGEVRRFVRSLPRRPGLEKKRLLGDPSLRGGERELLKSASGRIHYNDGMYTGDGAHYYKVGLEAIRLIDEALAAAGVESVGRILDLPCGYGRVLRFLTRRFPGAEITACDIQRGAVRFCAEEFGATPAHSSTDFAGVSLGERFKLAWCGSLVTHLDAASTRALVEFFRRQLAPGGVLVLTTHGPAVIQKMLRRELDYGLAEEDVPRLIAAYERNGFGFADYPGQSGYGVSLTSPDWIRGLIRRVGGLQEIFFRERGWDNHQDV